MEEISSMAHDVLVREFVGAIEYDNSAGELDMTPRTVAIRDEILRRMDSTARRVDVLPDGHRA